MKIISTLLFLIIVTNLLAQNQNEPCGFDRITNNKNIIPIELKIQEAVNKIKNSEYNKNLDDSIKFIPVVVHIIHNGGTENITEAQVQSQIQILNEDFGKLTGTNGEGNGVDTRVRFILAKIAPGGNCTNGIVRVKSALTNHQPYQRSLLKQLSFWDNTKYLNIYIVKTISGSVLGYSSFPGGPPDEDGIVVRHNVFGNIGTASTSLGRTATHEIGHWFGLYHTFNNACGTDICTDGDYVCDTPPVLTANFGCPSVVNSCTNDNPDLNDNLQNYLDYTDDACKNMLTDGQRLRIKATLDSIRTNIWIQSNLIETGIDSNYIAPAVCGVNANFVTLTKNICVGNNIGFIDISLNSPTTWKWSFTGGTPSSSTSQNPTVTYSTTGIYDVQLIVSSATTSDTLIKANYIDVSLPGVGDSLPFQENFDTGIFPSNGMYINNQDGGITWELDSNASVSGNYSVKINNLINTNYGSVDELILPYLDFTTHATNHKMTFKWAYSRSDALYSDELIVQLSSDCGNTFTNIFYKTGNNLVTGPTQTTPFIPDSTQWKSASINLFSYAAKQYVLIKIVNVTDGGNNLYIDDIKITGDVVTNIENINDLRSYNIYPNPATNEISIEGLISNNDEIQFLNSIGTTVKATKISQNNKITVNDLANGIYFIRISNQKNVQYKKLIINN